MDIPLKVPSLSIIFMIITLLICFCYPIGMAIYLHVKKKANISSFFIGCGVFILFALILENIFHQLILRKTGSFGDTILDNIWLKALYGGLAAGLFEETGRWISFKILLKKKQKPSNALMYGAGHGGIEAIILVGFTYIVNLIVSFMLNAGNVSSLLTDTANANDIMQSFAILTSTPSIMFLIGGIERLIAITLHICLSVFVYKAVTEVGKKYYFYSAILVHTVVNFIAVTVSSFYNIYVTELILGAFLVALVIITKKVYKQLNVNIEESNIEDSDIEDSDIEDSDIGNPDIEDSNIDNSILELEEESHRDEDIIIEENDKINQEENDEINKEENDLN